ncbi:Ribosomal RNA-processing protein 7 (RRP7) domain containing protein [Hyaloscypha variabilis]|jgi:ribosomal RNA-processing protein 7
MPKIGEYAILPISIPLTPAYPKTTTHTLYLRPHAPKIPTANDERSLFVVNVPIDSTVAHLRAVFATLVGAGRVEDVTFEHERKTMVPSREVVTVGKASKKRKRGSKGGEDNGGAELPQIWDRELRRSGSTAVVVLVDAKSVELALKAVRKLHKSSKKEKEKDRSWPVWGEGLEGKKPKLGSARYLAHHKLRYPDATVLKMNVDAFMTEFNRKEEERTKKEKRMRNMPDEDGFVTVTRGGRTGPARSEEAEQKKKEMDEKERKKREELQSAGFYRFQVREQRKAEQGELVKKFEEDRKRVGAMKEKRGRFRPER